MDRPERRKAAPRAVRQEAEWIRREGGGPQGRSQPVDRIGPSRSLTRASLAAAVRRLCALDLDLARVVRRYGHPPLWGRRPGFATLVRIVLEQQVSLQSARALYQRLRDELGQVTPDRLGRMGEHGLRALGFTRQKSAYCHGLSCSMTSGVLDLGRIARASDEAARAALRSLHGIGPWSADIYLLMALRRPDVWPSGDLALAEAARRVKRLRRRPSPAQLDRLAARWAPWRSVAARILWHYYLSTSRAAPFLPPRERSS